MAQKSGLLQLLTDDGERHIYFERGEIVFATSRAEDDRLGNFLYRRGLIEKKQLLEAEKQYKPGTRFGKLFVEMGFLQPKELWEAVRNQIEEIVYSVFSMHKGQFIFFQGDSLVDEDLSGFSLSSQNLLMEGIRRSDELPMIEEAISSEDAVPRKKDKPPKTELSKTEQRVLDLIDGKKNVRQVMRGSKLGEFDAKRVLFDLVKSKFIEIKLPGAGAPKKDPKERMREAVEEYNKIYAQLYKDLKTYANKINVDEALAAFFADLGTSRFAGMFKDTKLSPQGTLDVAAILENISKLDQGGGGATLAIAGLGELLNYELLTDGLNEFLNFEIFTVRNSCDDAAANEIVKKIRQIQSGLMS